MQDKNIFSSLDKTFGTEPTSIPSLVQKNDTMIDDDFDQARLALKQMIAKGQSAVEDISNIARQSDNPRAYEVTGELIKTVAETAKDLLQLQKQKRELEIVKKEEPKQIGTQNNIVFTGSTNDLLRLLNKENEKIINGDNQNSES